MAHPGARLLGGGEQGKHPHGCPQLPVAELGAGLRVGGDAGGVVVGGTGDDARTEQPYDPPDGDGPPASCTGYGLASIHQGAFLVRRTTSVIRPAATLRSLVAACRDGLGGRGGRSSGFIDAFAHVSLSSTPSRGCRKARAGAQPAASARFIRSVGRRGGERGR